MEIEFGVKPTSLVYDFEKVREGASIWVRKKTEAAGICRAFKDWAQENGALLMASWERATASDPRGPGWRVHFREAARYNVPVSERAASAAMRLWLKERTAPSLKRPTVGWHLMSALHREYLIWFEASSFQAGNALSVAKFSAELATIPGLTRQRVAAGSVVIGLALKGEPLGVHRVPCEGVVWDDDVLALRD